MCGIVGYIGEKDSVPVLMDGLSKLEYRGYDSAGVAVFDGPVIKVVKASGRLSHLEEKLETEGTPHGVCGIGHTRWATHGAPSDVNSHPHRSTSGRIVLVHNGIIENYLSLKEHLITKGRVFVSETDTEVAAQLIDYLYKGDLVDAVLAAISRIRGSYALSILCTDSPDRIVAVRKDSPLIIGKGQGENFIASDIPAILKHTKDYYLLDENEVAVVTKDAVTVYNTEKEPVEKELHTATWDFEAAEKGGYPHFMLKEIMETPRVLRDTIHPRIRDGLVDFSDEGIDDEYLRSVERIVLVACGSAMHVGIVGKYVIEDLARVPVEVDIASEYRYRKPIFKKGDLLLIISQSGETADTLAALRLAKQNGCRVLSIVNVLGSSIARESDKVIYTWAGPEIAVATTKAFSAQLSVMYLLAVRLGLAKGGLTREQALFYSGEIGKLPELSEKVLEKAPECQTLAAHYQNAHDLFFIGRGVDYAVSMEGSLKLKEISYVHSEAYAAGELKHGTISLVIDNTPVVALLCQSALTEKMVSNIREVAARNASVLVLCRESYDPAGLGEHSLQIPDLDDHFISSVEILPLQLFAYHIAVFRGCDVDKPRNLAKSVTVE